MKGGRNEKMNQKNRKKKIEKIKEQNFFFGF